MLQFSESRWFPTGGEGKSAFFFEDMAVPGNGESVNQAVAKNDVDQNFVFVGK